MTIDWKAPLETDEPTPRKVTAATVVADRGAPADGFGGKIDGTHIRHIWDNAGRSSLPGVPYIRNVRQPALRTSDEALQRMENLVRRMAVINECRDPFSKADGLYGEAAAIVKLLPVDPDLIEARKIAETVWRAQSERLSPLNEKRAVALGDGSSDHSPMVQSTFAAIKRGRELAAQ